MIESKSVTCIIPARLKSTRFPRKMLSILGGKPLVQWAWEAAKSTALFDAVAIATDDEEISTVAQQFGATVYMTSADCLSGTERMIELSVRGLIQSDIWVCWQGDEPFLTEQTIEELLQTVGSDDADMWTLKKRVERQEEIDSPHCVKVVCDSRGYALYFSRAPIPHYRDPIADEEKKFYKHIGIYAYSNIGLQKMVSSHPSPLELAEQLEQLRCLEQGMKIRVHETAHEGIGIDLPEHLVLAQTHLAMLGNSV